jgi:hypothetical protein
MQIRNLGHSYSIRIYDPVMDGGKWRLRTNQELYQLCGETDVKFCKLSRLR